MAWPNHEGRREEFSWYSTRSENNGETTPLGLLRPAADGARTSNEWRRDGGRVYIDLGSHPEWTTAETDDPVLLAERLFRGDLELFERASAMTLVPGTRCFLAANNVGFEQRPVVQDGQVSNQNLTSWASHDSYSIPVFDDGPPTSGLVWGLAAFQVSLVMIAGNGYFMPRTDGTYQFLLSERASAVTCVHYTSTTKSRALFMLREESLSSRNSGMFRLQVTGNDSNLQFDATWLRFALTDLALLGAINGELHVPYFNSDAQALLALKTINSDLTFKRRVEVVSAGGQPNKLTGLQIQRLHHKQLSAFADKYNLTQYRSALDAWVGILDAIEWRDFDKLAYRLGWATRLVRSREYEDRLERSMNGAEASAFGVKLSTIFDSKYRQPKTGKHMSPLLAMRRRFVDPAVLARVAIPEDPQTMAGRAGLRARLLTRAGQLGYRVDIEVSNWTKHIIHLPGGRKREFTLGDPFANHNAWLEAWLAETAPEVA